ncbi:MAG TPA: hypothetical protein PL195_04885 [bacterium]|nr:hypothetical protein [bacterium]
MYRKLFVVFIFIALAVPFYAAAKAIGPEVSEYRGQELKWEDGAYGYHVMFKSLLENLQADQGNPQADACKNSSTYTLDPAHVPLDALVSQAFLIWAGAQPIAKANDTTDSEVTLSYSSTENGISETQVIKGKKAYKISEAAGFEFDAFKDIDNPNHSYFTYRVDVTEFFKNIHDKGRELGLEYDGASLYGNYTLSDLECASDSSYIGSTEMVSGWTLVIIYSSIEISPKKIYMYDGFKAYFHELSEIGVTGFEFPTDPEVRITLVTHEGDPNLAVLENPNGGPAIPEGLQVQGDQVGWLLLWNECNPEAFETNGMTTLYYTEIYNSISSVYGWADVDPTCVGGVPPVWDYEAIEYAIDADTFVMDSASDGSYASHFNKGGQRINLRIGANQDQIITNFMLVSVDTKAPKFDIPGQPEKVACTPANIPVEPGNPESKWCEGNVEHTFAIRVQNWGDDITPSVIVKDTIPTNMEYVPGSTEYATEFKVDNNKQIAKKWMKIPDNGGFPLESGFKVADKMDFCDAGSDYLSCSDLIMVRFKAKVKSGTPKHSILENTASIDSAGLSSYKTNLGMPVKLRLETSGCVSNADDVNLDDCGGIGVPGCEKDEDCAEGFKCDTEENICVDNQEKCEKSDITVSVGKNSPVSDIIFIAPQENLVVGQIEVTNASGKECYFNLASLKLRIDLSENNIVLKNIKLVVDVNGDGIVDSSDRLISSVEALKDNYADFASSDPANRLMGNVRNNLLFVLDAGYKDGEQITRNSTFTPSIEEGGINITDSGKPTIKGIPLDFSKFQFEPDDAFIVTKGPNDPAVPAKNEMNKTLDILQLKVVSKSSDDKIKSIFVKIPKATMAKFGSAINNLSIYEDTDNDGKGDTKLITASSTDSTTSHEFKVEIPFTTDVPKYLTIRATLNMKDGDSFQIQIPKVSIDSDKDKLGLPVNSKEYSYTCDPVYEDCGGDDGGCSISSISTAGMNITEIISAIALFVSAFLVFFRRSFGK